MYMEIFDSRNKTIKNSEQKLEVENYQKKYGFQGRQLELIVKLLIKKTYHFKRKIISFLLNISNMLTIKTTIFCTFEIFKNNFLFYSIGILSSPDRPALKIKPTNIF